MPANGRWDLIRRLKVNEVCVVFHLLTGDRFGAVGVCNAANYGSYVARMLGGSGAGGRRTRDLANKINIDCTGA